MNLTNPQVASDLFLLAYLVGRTQPRRGQARHNGGQADDVPIAHRGEVTRNVSVYNILRAAVVAFT